VQLLVISTFYNFIKKTADSGERGHAFFGLARVNLNGYCVYKLANDHYRVQTEACSSYLSQCQLTAMMVTRYAMACIVS